MKILAILIVFSSSYLFSTPEAGNMPVGSEDIVVARIDSDHEIRLSDIVKVLQVVSPYLKGMRQEDMPALIAFIRDQLIHSALITREAKLSKEILNDPEVKERIKKAEDTIYAEALLNKVTKSTVTEKRLKEAYEEYKRSVPKDEQERRARVILVKQKEDAEAVISALSDGASFEALARQKSTVKELGERDGDLGYVRKNASLDRTLIDKIFTQKVGELPKDYIKMATGEYAVVYVVDVRKVQPESYEKKAPLLQQKLVTEARMAYFETLVKQAEAKGMSIERYTVDGKPDKPSQIPENLKRMLGSMKF